MSSVYEWNDTEAREYLEEHVGIQLGNPTQDVSFYPHSRHMPDRGATFQAFKHSGFTPIPQDQSNATYPCRDYDLKANLVLSKFEVKVKGPNGFEWLITLKAIPLHTSFVD